MPSYSITKEQCQQSIDNLGHVCDRCAGVIVPIETVDNMDNPTFWSGCETCQQFTQGVDKELYKISDYMVRSRWFVAYHHLGGRPKEESDEYEKWILDQIQGTHKTVSAIITRAVMNGFVQMPATGQPFHRYCTLINARGEEWLAKVELVNGYYQPVKVFVGDTWYPLGERNIKNYRCTDYRANIQPTSDEVQTNI